MNDFMSGWAATHGGDEPDGPRNVTPGRTPRQASPGLAAILRQHDAAGIRMDTQRRKAVGFLWRAAIAFALSTLPVPHWVGISLFWLTVAFLLAAGHRFYEYRCARIETATWPD